MIEIKSFIYNKDGSFSPVLSELGQFKNPLGILGSDLSKKIYLAEGCIVPFKAKKALENRGLQFTKDPELADQIVYKNLSTTRRHKKTLKYVHGSYISQNIWDTANQELEKQGYTLGRALKNRVTVFFHTDSDFRNNFIGNYYEYDAVDPNIEWVNNTTAEICDYTQILRMIGNSGEIITRETYFQLMRFIKTGDLQNQKMAVRIMANSDIDSSVVYLYFILKNHGTELKNKGLLSSVEMQGILSKLDIDVTRYIDYQKIIDKIRKINLLSPTNLKEAWYLENLGNTEPHGYLSTEYSLTEAALETCNIDIEEDEELFDLLLESDGVSTEE